MIADMTFSEVRLLADIISRLERLSGEVDARAEILTDITLLLRADFASSYIWDSKAKKFDSALNLNISDESIRKYQGWYQYHDPLTFEMRKLGCAVVSEAMSYAELYKTEYYNEVLSEDGLRYGINLYLLDDCKDLGDLRVWRSAQRSDFQTRDKELLSIIAPFLKNSLVRFSNLSDHFSCLTPREKDVASLVCKGFTDREIAAFLSIGFSTVRTHLNSSMSKLGCANRAELAAHTVRASGDFTRSQRCPKVSNCCV